MALPFRVLKEGDVGPLFETFSGVRPKLIGFVAQNPGVADLLRKVLISKKIALHLLLQPSKLSLN
jgi:hypothetical protein